MKISLGTKTLLFGVHQIFVHPALVTWAWVHLYGSFPSFKEFVCIFIHDWGYWGVEELKGEEGDRHPELGAKIATKLFGKEWGDFVLGHSMYYCTRNNLKRSSLFDADKYWHCMVPFWFYRILSQPTGELQHYRELKHDRQVAEPHESDFVWFCNLKEICKRKIDGTYEINISKLATDRKNA